MKGTACSALWEARKELAMLRLKRYNQADELRQAPRIDKQTILIVEGQVTAAEDAVVVIDHLLGLYGCQEQSYIQKNDAFTRKRK
jgi:ribosomal protein L30/L7E